jgi:hypothetical protein
MSTSQDKIYGTGMFIFFEPIPEFFWL